MLSIVFVSIDTFDANTNDLQLQQLIKLNIGQNTVMFYDWLFTKVFMYVLKHKV